MAELEEKLAAVPVHTVAGAAEKNLVRRLVQHRLACVATLHPSTITIHRHTVRSQPVKRRITAAMSGMTRQRRNVMRYKMGFFSTSMSGLPARRQPMMSIDVGTTQFAMLLKNWSGAPLNFHPVASMMSIARVEMFSGVIRLLSCWPKFCSLSRRKLCMTKRNM